jgi:multidrug efflux pump subunit AcrA (membrane-fusion protein)
MVATVSVLSEKPKKLILIPLNAVHSLNNIKVVYIMKDNKITQKRIQTSSNINDHVIVEKGLAEGDMLIVSGVDSVKTDSGL